MLLSVHLRKLITYWYDEQIIKCHKASPGHKLRVDLVFTLIFKNSCGWENIFNVDSSTCDPLTHIRQGLITSASEIALKDMGKSTSTKAKWNTKRREACASFLWYIFIWQTTYIKINNITSRKFFLWSPWSRICIPIFVLWNWVLHLPSVPMQAPLWIMKKASDIDFR